MPGYANPQNLNRYSYVTNNPLRYTDPTGHMADYGGNEGGGGCNSLICFPQAPSNPPLSNNTDNNDDNIDDYSGPLHSDVKDQLEAQGADPDLLSSVTIYVNTTETVTMCGTNQLAVTANSDIYICALVANNGEVVYDPYTPTPVLLHELVHVRQFRDNKLGTWIEIYSSKIKKAILKEKYNPYTESWVEIQGSSCQSAYTADPNISLDSGVCNLR